MTRNPIAKSASTVLTSTADLHPSLQFQVPLPSPAPQSSRLQLSRLQSCQRLRRASRIPSRLSTPPPWLVLQRRRRHPKARLSHRHTHSPASCPPLLCRCLQIQASRSTQALPWRPPLSSLQPAIRQPRQQPLRRVPQFLLSRLKCTCTSMTLNPLTDQK